ncbi:hypothetical protein [Janthinobacterium sp. PC23-8]|uniref:hypothetical protein n=1 Tax=Janthinobacterium sp. PC23-8 TaxID=2012679 RepID=UPI000B97B81B|nr:hypothetical protein [Janthinobacterium sp. PC23-8]OYO27907.1 hypothetical protein CD932_22610 [Janthinobacterium sp. PC23-8]
MNQESAIEHVAPTTASIATATAVGATSRALPTFAPGFYPIAIGAAFAEGVYAGVVRGVNGAPDQHLLLIDGEVDGVIWDTACIWAESVGGSLPTRAEQAVLFGNLKDHFQRDWYWSSEQAGPSTAWDQYFLDGTQSSLTRSYEGRARAVRRLPI